jgi:hypothetical protein
MSNIRLTLSDMSPSRRVAMLLLAAVAGLALLILGCAQVLRSSGHNHDAPGGLPTKDRGAPPPVTAPGQLTSTLAPSDSAAVANDIARLAATPDVSPATSSEYPAIPAGDRAQPDLYARAFVTELLTQDYRTNRIDLLAWAQSESAQCSEPLVVGLVPADLRHKLGLWSLTDATDGSETPIPSAAEWKAWGDRSAHSTVTILRVTEPAKWAEAVSAGRLSDPGVTARDVDAEVTIQWIDHGRWKSSRRSVSLSLTLEGPPSLSGYGFVNAVNFDSVAGG